MPTPETAAKAGIQQGLRSLGFRVDGMTPPSVNHYVKHRVIAGHLGSYKTATAKRFAIALALAAAGRTIAPESDRERAKVKYRVSVDCYLGKGVRLDADNPLKVTLDAMVAAGVIHSDASVFEVIGRVHKEDRGNPRTEIYCEVV